MFYIVQKNVFKEHNYNKIFEALDRLELDYEIVDFDKDGEVIIETDRKDIFVFGSVRLARLSIDKGWYPGSFYGGNHDFNIYKDYYKDNLLNYDSEIQQLSKPIEFNKEILIGSGMGFREGYKFIRPCKDSKVFTGALFSKTKWEDLVERIKQDVLIQVSTPKKIYKEARIWIVDSKIVTSSYYKFGDNVLWEENVEPEGIEFAEKMIKLFEIAPAYVMDICLTYEGWKIVEINCINCSGFYQGDLQKIIIALENKFI